jgi:large subunit ribosomal protein L14e
VARDIRGKLKMFNVGRLCTKIAGRDAGCKCVIVEELDNGLVLVDGQTRRRKCNTKHLEPSKERITLKSGASHADVKKAFEALNIEVIETKPKTPGPKPVKAKAKKVVEEKPAKKKAKPEVKAVEKAKAEEAQAETVEEVQAELAKEE